MQREWFNVVANRWGILLIEQRSTRQISLSRQIVRRALGLVQERLEECCIRTGLLVDLAGGRRGESGSSHVIADAETALHLLVELCEHNDRRKPALSDPLHVTESIGQQ